MLCPPDPAHQRANGNLKYFEYQLAKQRKAEEEEGGKKESKDQGKEKEADYLPERRKYEKLCRGEGITMVGTQTQRLCLDSPKIIGCYTMFRK